MHKTYAPTAITIGILLGILIGMETNPVLGVIAAIGISVGGWVLIRFLENSLQHAGDAAVDAISRKMQENKQNQQRSMQNNQNANMQYQNGQPQNSQPVNGQYPNAQFRNGQPVNGQYPNTQFQNGQPVSGQYPNNQNPGSSNPNQNNTR